MNNFDLEHLTYQQNLRSPKRSHDVSGWSVNNDYTKLTSPSRVKAYSEDQSPGSSAIKIKMQRRSNLATNLSIDADVKLNHTLSKEEREI